MVKALITNIQGYSIHDGPGIRTLVFFKGCRLKCRWCANPECISPQSEIGFIKNLCTRCGKCEGVCTENALDFSEDGLPRINRDRCTGCGECVSVCYYKALVRYGEPMTVAEVFDSVKRDSMFYITTGGGVTVSGGDPLLHPQFVRSLFEQCREAGIHTCVETSGEIAESNLRDVLPVTDYVLYDLKCLDSKKHRELTGRPNSNILSNARVAAQSGVEMLFRMPLIPGINDTAQNIEETAEFIKQFDENTRRIELMPYHRMGESKYRALDKSYALGALPSADNGQVNKVKQEFEEQGIQCSVSH